MKISVNSRNTCSDDFIDILKRYDNLSDDDREIFDTAIRVIFHLFDKDPEKYGFDFRFNRVT